MVEEIIKKECKHEYKAELVQVKYSQLCFIFCKNCGDTKRLY